MKKKKSKAVESEEEEEEEEEDTHYSYANPYKEMDDAFDKSDILDILSKNTANDKKNAKLYKKEMGKYQFSVRSEHNKAAKMSKAAKNKAAKHLRTLYVLLSFQLASLTSSANAFITTYEIRKCK